MAWNSPQRKDIQGASAKGLAFGAPVSTDPAKLIRGYHDSWDIERAWQDGAKKVTWVFRCIDAIAGNVARLPARGRKNNDPKGTIVTNRDELQLLNMRANPGEDSFAFRYRLSSQLLLSTRGAFVEMVRGRGGQVVALHLLPPQFTSPIPDPKKFVSGYEVVLPNGSGPQILKPEDVLWFKRPHPLDPYLSSTPMEAAGVAIEIENLSRLYNRNFLINDGRPGGLLVIRGEIDEDDRQELESRYRPNIARTGSVSVIASEDGADFIDTGANPRDAAYSEMRRITKEEILAAFGVPESQVGNASGRTYANAAEEGRVFWYETLGPHMEMLARGFDSLIDDLWIDFDTSEVPALMYGEQEMHRFLLEEQRSGLISVNEYRIGTGRKKVKSDLADSLLFNPNVMPIANTTKAMPSPDAAGGMAGAVPGAVPGAPGAVPGVEGGVVPGAEAGGMPPEGMPPEGGAMPPDQGGMPPAGAAPEGGVPVPAGEEALPPEEDDEEEELLDPAAQLRELANPTIKQRPVRPGGIETKSENKAEDDWEVKTETTVDRWTQILDRNLERLYERQQRVVLEKAMGAKSQKMLMAGSLATPMIFDADVWNRQLNDDIRPILAGIVAEAAENMGRDEVDAEQVRAFLNDQVRRLQKVNSSLANDIAAAIISASAMDSYEDRGGLLKTALMAIFVDLSGRRRENIAAHEAQTAYNAGTYFASLGSDKSLKTWVTRGDGRVRDAHKTLAGKTVGIGEGFTVKGATLRFPGDPLAPLDLTMGCRCRLRLR